MTALSAEAALWCNECKSCNDFAAAVASPSSSEGSQMEACVSRGSCLGHVCAVLGSHCVVGIHLPDPLLHV